jgi:DNA-binding phage protein
MQNALTSQLDVNEVAEHTATLLTDLSAAQQRLGLSDVEIATRTGLNRATVRRAKTDGGDPQLSSFVAMAAALGLSPSLNHLDEASGFTMESSVIHRGYAYARINRDQDWRDTQREAAFAKSWEAINEHSDHGLTPAMRNLVPNHTQAQASAAATVVQWLGSDIGFDFLRQALASAGYDIVDTTARKK